MNGSLVVAGSQHAKAADRELPREAIAPLQVLTDGSWEALTVWSNVGRLGIAGIAWDEPTRTVWIATDDALIAVRPDGMTQAPVEGLVDVHELSIHGRHLFVASTGTDSIVTVDLDSGVEVGRRSLVAMAADHVTEAFVRVMNRTERFHVNQAFQDMAGREWALVHHVTGVQVVQEVGARLLKRQGDGGLVLIDGDERIDLGLSAPHSMRFIAGEWWVLDSGVGTAVILDGHWARVGTMSVGGWGRGAALQEDGRLAVGISRVRSRYRHRLRALGNVDNHIVWVDPDTRSCHERLTVPNIDQVNAVAVVPDEALELLRAP